MAQRDNRVTITASLHDLDHDGRLSTDDENTVYSSCSGFPSRGHKSTPVKHKHVLFPPACNSPLITEDLPGMPCRWCLLSITGLAALGSAKW